MQMQVMSPSHNMPYAPGSLTNRSLIHTSSSSSLVSRGGILPHKNRPRSKTDTTGGAPYPPHHLSRRYSSLLQPPHEPYPSPHPVAASTSWMDVPASHSESNYGFSLDEERKPTLGINGSPHLSDTNSIPPPMSPSPSSRSRDSPVGPMSYGQMGTNFGAQPGSGSNSEHSPGSASFTLSSHPSTSMDDHVMSNGMHISTSMYGPTSTNGVVSYTSSVYPTPANSAPSSENGYPNKSANDYEYEIAKLKNQLREAQFSLDRERSKLAELQTGQELERQLSNDPGAHFKASWNQRTEARIKQLCSLNRAGNALCAWHDSRRERRQYAPRNAPTGVLNCGCTYEEALFEEALTRQGVGSYHPGESVRMDPVLRNPLLRLLQTRYNYRDGDFERMRMETDNGEELWVWPESDGPDDWALGTAKVGNSVRRNSSLMSH